MKLLFRVLSLLIGVLFVVQGVGWLVDPRATAEGLGMELLTGVGASTQIGDLAAFFVAVAIMIGLAQRPGEARWLYPPALLIGCAAVLRTLAAVLGHADFAPQFIGPELVMTAILVGAARVRADERVAPERLPA